MKTLFYSAFYSVLFFATIILCSMGGVYLTLLYNCQTTGVSNSEMFICGGK